MPPPRKPLSKTEKISLAVIQLHKLSIIEGKEMQKRKKTKIKKSTLVVIAFLIFITIMIVISTLNNQKTQAKPPAREYFKIEDATALAEPVDPPQNQKIRVKMLSFKITPIKEDAHYVSINPGGNVKYDDWPWFEEIKCNETIELAEAGKEITYGTTPIQATKTENGYVMTIRITCAETSALPDDQKVTIYIEEPILT